jgi:hypothetical protein
MRFFWKTAKIYSVLSVYVEMGLKFIFCLFICYSKYCSESCIKIYVLAFFYAVGPLLLVNFLQSTLNKIPGYRNNCQDHRWLPVCILRVKIFPV